MNAPRTRSGPPRLVPNAAAFLLGLTTAATAQLCPLPFAEDAEDLATGPLAGQGSDWTIDDGDPQVVPGAGAGGSAGIDANGDNLCVMLDEDGEAITWTDFRIRPKAMLPTADPAPDPTPAADTAAAFFFNTAGQLEALDGTTWAVVASGLDLEAMYRICLRTNYTTQRWTLWLDGSEVATEFAFANPVAAPAKFRSNRAARVIDDLRVHTYPLVEGYDAWRSGHLWPNPGTDDGLLADGDHDHTDNLLEYAFASNPLSGATSGRPAALRDGDDVTLTFNWNRAATDLSWQLQGSYDMVNWDDIDPDETTAAPSTDGVSDVLTVRKQIADPFYFLRLEIPHP